MLITYLLFITCQKPIIINESGLEWNLEDKRTVDRAIATCLTKKDYINNPCLKTFYKRGFGEYAAICGGEEGRKW